MMHRLAYASRALIRAHSPDMLDIVRCALRDNPRAAITGALYFDDAQFFQVIEGPDDSIEALWRKLLTDPRHHDVKLLRRETVTARMFGAWSMKFHDGALGGQRWNGFRYESLCGAGSDLLDAEIETLRAL